MARGWRTVSSRALGIRQLAEHQDNVIVTSVTRLGHIVTSSDLVRDLS